MSGSGGAGEDRNNNSRISEGIRESTHAGGSDGEPADPQRMAAVPGREQSTTPVARPFGFVADWYPGIRSPSGSPAPINEDRLFWDIDGTRRGGPFHTGVTATVVDIPQPPFIGRPYVGGDIIQRAIIAPADPLALPTTQAIEVDTLVHPSTANYTRHLSPGQGTIPFVTEATEVDTPHGQGNTPFATEATEADTPRGQEDQIEEGWTSRTSMGRATLESQVTPHVIAEVQPTPRREAQSMGLPWDSRTSFSSSLQVPVETWMGNGRQQRASSPTLRPVAASTHTSLLATERDTPVHGRDVLVLPWTLRSHSVMGRGSSRNPAMRGHVTRRSSRLIARVIQVPGTQTPSQPPPQPQPIDGGAVGRGNEDRLRVASSELSCVAETDLGLLTRGEREAATGFSTDVDVRGSESWDGESITTSMREMVGLGSSTSRKRKAGELPAPTQQPCITVVTQWACGHSEVTSVTHAERCLHGGQVGRVSVMARAAPVFGACPQPTTRMVLSSTVCARCDPKQIGGRSEAVGGWVSNLIDSKRVRR